MPLQRIKTARQRRIERAMKVDDDGVTWARLAAEDPRLEFLRSEADEAYDRYRPQANNRRWFARYKPHMASLVGHNRRAGPAWLQTSAAYDIAYDVLYETAT
jgi:aminoglycoside phosphotransferase